MKEDKASWVSFFQRLRGRGLDGVKLIVGDKCMGMLEAVGEVFPDAKYQRSIVHFYRNVFSVVPRSKVKMVAKMLDHPVFQLHLLPASDRKFRSSSTCIRSSISSLFRFCSSLIEALRGRPFGCGT